MRLLKEHAMNIHNDINDTRASEHKSQLHTHGVLTASIEISRVKAFLTNKLRSHLPYGIPLYRRCQFHLHESRGEKYERRGTNDASAAEIFIARVRNSPVRASDTDTSSDTIQLESWLHSWLDHPEAMDDKVKNDQEDWIAAHIDLSNTGESQVWVFASWESRSRPEALLPSTNVVTAQRTLLFQALYARIRSHHIPLAPSTPPERWKWLLQSGKIVSQPYSRTKVLFAAFPDVLWPYLEDDVVLSEGIPSEGTVSCNPSQASKKSKCITRQDKGYLKYILPLSPKQRSSAEGEHIARALDFAQAPTPPVGYHFAPLHDHHLHLMLDRSNIPRTLHLLRSLVNVGLYPVSAHTQLEDPGSAPIAWGILSKDGSISSLHTEEEHRGRGVAELVARQLIYMQQTAAQFGFESAPNEGGDQSNATQDDNIDFAHADVSETNRPSQRVFDKLGGTVMWQVGWIEVDMAVP